MSFAAKPFSAASQQSASTQRASQRSTSTRPWPHQQKQPVSTQDFRAVAGGSRLSGWSAESRLQWQRRTQPEVTFEFWCSPSSRRRLTKVSRPASPTEAALALVLLPVTGFACSCSSDIDASELAAAPLTPPDQSSPSPSSLQGNSTDAADVEEFEATQVQLQEDSEPSTPQNQQQQASLSSSPWRAAPAPSPAPPAPSRQQSRPLTRPVSTGPTEQLLRLVRLSYTHSDLATRRLLKSSLLHRSRPEPVAVDAPSVVDGAGGGGGGAIDSGAVSTSSSGGGLLPKRRFPRPTPVSLRGSGEQPPMRLWSQEQCLSLPPLVPNS
ncbi:hypothetical protein BOX15_Mlig020362g1 [Macrostomum lignano]|uniref:Uncharacterized protein n=1 Tax=Macrostomum lignano TaxID=282301 RepID=A0A267EZQ6_9PLAT|nr:hypothetical protein BOX15_Mlig020362g1 [Macrostomum lignano]